MTSLEELTKIGREQAEGGLLGKREETTPFFTLVRRDNSVMLISAPWRNDAEKHDLVLSIALTIVREDVIQFSFLCESWMASCKLEGGDLPPPHGLRPSERADRIEAIFCLCGDGKRTLFSSWEIVRNQHGVCIDLKNGEPHPAMDSWISDMLNQAILLCLTDPTGEFRREFGMMPPKEEQKET